MSCSLAPSEEKKVERLNSAQQDQLVDYIELHVTYMYTYM